MRADVQYYYLFELILKREENPNLFLTFGALEI